MTHNPESTAYLMKRLWRGYMVNHLGKLFWGGFFMILAAVSTAGLAYLIEPAIDLVVGKGDQAFVILIPVAVVIVSFVRGGANYLQSVILAKLSMSVVNTIQKQMFAKLVRADLSFLYQDASGIKLSRFLADAMFLREALAKVFTGLARDLVLVVVLVVFMFYQDWRLASAAFFAFPIAVLPILLLGRRLRKVSRQTQTQLGEMTAMLDENFKAVRQVKSYAMEEWEEKRSGRDFDFVKQLFVKMVEVRSRNYLILDPLGGAAIAAVIAYGGFRATTGDMTVGGLTSFIAALMMAFQPIKSIASLNSALQQGLAAAVRIFELLDTKPTIVDKVTAGNLNVTEGNIQFKDIDFSYDENAQVLEGLNLNIKAGSKVAFVGRSGAGKSSLLNLLLRFYEPQAGQLLIDGSDIQDVTLKSLRSNIGLVSQDTVLLNDTIAENIRYGRIDATDEEVVEAAKKAHVDEFVSQMQDGYKTMVGEQGVLLSGGQKQRVAIARAILKNAPILLLDEATSALDSKSEKAVQGALDDLMVGRTTIIISHRLATVLNADHIYMMSEGKITAEGTHEQLESGNAAYQDLHQL